MNQYEVRRLQAGEELVLKNVAAGVFDNAVDIATAKEYLAVSHNVFYVAMTDDLVVGMVSAILYCHPDKPKELWINEIGVGDEYRRQGIGKKLMYAMEKYAQDANCAGCWLLTEADNTQAKAFYRSLPRWSGPNEQVMYYTEMGPGR